MVSCQMSCKEILDTISTLLNLMGFFPFIQKVCKRFMTPRLTLCMLFRTTVDTKLIGNSSKGLGPLW